jgi:type IV pilus assembly protein PilA
MCKSMYMVTEPDVRKQSGFSLIELLIVVAIILIIAAIAIPSLLRARISANEASAASGIRTITTAQITYFQTFQIGYADTLGKLGPPSSGGCAGSAGSSTSACLIDWVVADATTVPKSGYEFQVSIGSSGDTQSYVASTFADVWDRTGVRSFCAVEDHIIHVKFPTGQDSAVDAAGCMALTTLNN